jgi:hypothetical protein
MAVMMEFIWRIVGCRGQSVGHRHDVGGEIMGDWRGAVRLLTMQRSHWGSQQIYVTLEVSRGAVRCGVIRLDMMTTTDYCCRVEVSRSKTVRKTYLTLSMYFYEPQNCP